MPNLLPLGEWQSRPATPVVGGYVRRITTVLLSPYPWAYLLLRQPVALLLDGVRNQAIVAVIPCVDVLLCESIVEHRFSLAVGLRRIEISIRLSACGVKDWILVSAQISERLFIEENALQFTVVGQQELSRERLQFSHSSNLHIRPPLLSSLPRGCVVSRSNHNAITVS